MKFAFLLMGDFDAKADHACLRGGDVRCVGVGGLEEACDVARGLADEGFSCIKLCGAFGEVGARRVIEATGGAVAVGYVVHLPEQDALFSRVFGENRAEVAAKERKECS